MKWAHYREQYTDYLDSTGATMVATVVASRVLRNFPRGLPDPLREESLLGMERFAKVMAEGAKRSQTGEKWSKSLSLSPLAQATVMLLLNRILGDRQIQKIDFERILLPAQLVTTIAYTEAFLNDSLRAIAAATPNVLRREYNLSWKRALDFRSSSELLRFMRDELVDKEFRGLSIGGKLRLLAERFGVEHGVPDSLLCQIAEAEEVRHVFVHNGGRIDRQLLERTELRGRIGRPFPLTRKYVLTVVGTCRNLCVAVFRAVSLKHFKIAPGELAKYGAGG